MAHATTPARTAGVRRDLVIVGLIQVLAVALVVGWFATGHASAPDAGLLQLDVLSLDEKVPGVDAVDGRPTMVVAVCPGTALAERSLDEAYGLVVSKDPELARRLSLPRAATDCQAGYVLLDGAGRVRYRSYDPGWQQHSYEQEILLENLAGATQ